MPKYVDYDSLIGRKINRLTFIKVTHKGNRSHVFCDVKCDCGTVFNLSAYSFTSGNTKSCGCFAKELLAERSRNNRKYSNSAIGNEYLTYQRSAKRRGYYFNLSYDEFYSLAKSNCHYCGTEPIRKIVHNHSVDTEIINGIDRVDNNKGYDIDNVVPCCTTCNFAKHSMSYEEYMSYLRRLVQWQNNLQKD